MDKILIIDDDVALLEMLKLYLETENFQVDIAPTKEASDRFISKNYDLILLDVNMPEEDGFSYCSRVREQVTCPIVFLSGCTSTDEQIQGLQVGGDDYLLKPFDMDELVARIKAHLRRENRVSGKSEFILSSGLMVDFSGKKLTYRGEIIPLSAKEFSIVEVLIKNKGVVFDREHLYEKVWGYDALGDSGVLKEHIRKIRNKLMPFKLADQLETVWGVGYKWKR